MNSDDAIPHAVGSSLRDCGNHDDAIPHAVGSSLRDCGNHVREPVAVKISDHPRGPKAIALQVIECSSARQVD
jgi:hypothetical protein